jgi:hypothetical protein
VLTNLIKKFNRQQIVSLFAEKYSIFDGAKLSALTLNNLTIMCKKHVYLVEGNVDI